MSRLLNVLLLFLCMSASLLSQPVVDEFFRIGESHLPMLSLDQRRDLVDFYRADRAAHTSTQLGDGAVLESMSDSTLTVRLSPNSRMELVLLPLDSTYLCLSIFSIEGSFCQSRMSLWNRKGDLLDVSLFFSSPKLQDFVGVDFPADSLSILERSVGLYFVSHRYDSVRGVLESRVSVSGEGLSDDGFCGFGSGFFCLFESRWDGRRFVGGSSR